MGLRFRKSVKICKGVRVNLSKSGASLSVGGKGQTVNFSSRGTRVTTGIPGTGLSYSTMLGKGTRGGQRRSVSMPSNVNMEMDNNGSITFKDGNGRMITDPSVIRKIRSTDYYRNMKDAMDRERLRKNSMLVEEAELENEKFLNIYQLAPAVLTKEDFEDQLNNLEVEEYEPIPYNTPLPDQAIIRSQLEAEAETKVKGNFFTIKNKKKQYVEDNLPIRMKEAYADWEKGKEYHENRQALEKEKAEEQYQKEYDEQKVYLESIINGDEDSVFDSFDEWIANCELPVEINIDYFWNEDHTVFMLDVDLPEIEDLPSEKMIQLDSGNLKQKKKTQAELRGEYATLVFGLAIFISANLFNMSPYIENILISGFTQRRNKDGDINNDYIYSIQFTRNQFEATDLTRVDPREFCMSFTNRCNMTTTSLFKVITPFESFE